jgi:hypothetical protein
MLEETDFRPTSVRVLGIDIKVVYSKDLDPELHGQYDPDTLTIEVSDGLNAENTRLVLWHELVHVIESLGSLTVSETAVCLFSTGFIQILKDNPTLAFWSFGITPERGCSGASGSVSLKV